MPAAASGVANAASIEKALRLAPRARALNALTWIHDDPVGEFSRVFKRSDPRTQNLKTLAGIPIVVKDNIDVAGASTTAGTPALRENVANDDAPVIRILKDAGAIVVAKSNLHELALGATSINPSFGTVLNPFDSRVTAGGSSGGSAAAVSLGMVSLAVGTDTSGSCRVPASCCGIVGFRPSLNRYPIDRIVPISFNRDTVGLLAHSVDRIIAADGVLAPNRYLPTPRRERIRLGIPSRLAYEGVSTTVGRVFEAATKRLLGAGVELIACEISGTPDLLWSVQVAIITFDMPRHLETYLLRSNSGIDIATLVSQIGDPVVKRRLDAMMIADVGEAAREHAAALIAMRRLKQEVREVMRTQRLDALFYPTMITTPPRVTEIESIDVDGETRATGPTLLRNTLLASLAGMPSLSMPIGFAENGHPVGALLEGCPGADATLLALGASLEPVLGDRK